MMSSNAPKIRPADTAQDVQSDDVDSVP